jgi:hypothetical protein
MLTQVFITEENMAKLHETKAAIIKDFFAQTLRTTEESNRAISIFLLN